MKKLSLLLVCVLVLASVATMFVSASDATYTAAYATTKPSVYGDGYTWDTAWDIGTWATIGNAHDTNHGSTEAPKFKILHDASNIYICVVYKDTNGTIQQSTKNAGGENVVLGAENLGVAFVDASGNQQAFLFTAPYINKGDASMNVYIEVMGVWQENLSSAGNDADGFRGKAIRGEDGTIHFELRIPKAKVGATGDSIQMELTVNDSAKGDQWNYENFVWAGPAQRNLAALKATETFGTLVFAAKGATQTPVTQDTTTAQPEDTTTAAPVQQDTTAAVEDTTEAVTEAVIDTTEAAEDTTAEVVDTTEAVEDTTEAVIDTTEASDEPEATEKADEPTTGDTEAGMNTGLLIGIIAAVVVVIAVVAVVAVKAKKKAN